MTKEQIVNTVCEVCGTSIEEIRSHLVVRNVAAARIKSSGKIDGAIKQIGRKIIIDADLALDLAGRKTGGRR